MNDWGGIDFRHAFENAIPQFVQDCTRMCRRKVRDILPNSVSMMLSHDPCFGVSTYWNRFDRNDRKAWVSLRCEQSDCP